MKWLLNRSDGNTYFTPRSGLPPGVKLAKEAGLTLIAEQREKIIIATIERVVLTLISMKSNKN